MPIKQRALLQNPATCSRAWQQVNREFELVRKAVKRANDGTVRLTNYEWQILLNGYRQVRAVLYELLPAVEEREG